MKPLEDLEFIGAKAAFKCAEAKAVAHTRATGLEPVISNPEDWPKT